MPSDVLLLVPLAVFFLALIGPLHGLPRRSFWCALAAQCALLPVWSVFGWVTIGGWWWRASGGCAGNGGGFEGACGYSGVAMQFIAAVGTTIVMTAIVGIVLRLALRPTLRPTLRQGPGSNTNPPKASARGPSGESPTAPRPAPETEAMTGQFADAENPIHAFLDALGVPWQTPRETLLDRFGTRIDPIYHWRACPLSTAQPILDGLLLPLQFAAPENDKASPRLPPTVFTATAWWENDARANMLRAHAAIAARLGHRPIERQHNVFITEWCFGTASLRLMVFPPDMQHFPSSNPAKDREPRLATAVHLTVQSGFRPPLGTVERGWLDTFVPVETMGARPIPADEVRATAAPDEVLQFVREPPEDLERFMNRLGRSADGEGLIFAGAQLYMAPMDCLTGFHVERLTQAKGAASSWLSMGLKNDTPPHAIQYIHLMSSSDTHGLDDMAARLAEAFDRPFTLAHPEPNA